jgi:hypothetical protein
LAGGALNPDGQKQLSGVLRQSSDMVPKMFYGKEKPEEMLKNLKDMEAVLEKLEDQAHGK